MIEETSDQRVARKLNDHPDNIRAARERYSNEPVIRAVMRDRIETAIEEQRTKLETAKGEDVYRHQGSISGLRTALAAIESKI